MAGKIHFKLNPDYLPTLRRSAWMAEVLGERALLVEEEAKRLAPVGRYAGGGRYKDGIEKDLTLGADGLVGRVNANHFTSWWIEAGTVRTPAFAPLRRALEHVMGHIAATDRGEEL